MPTVRVFRLPLRAILRRSATATAPAAPPRYALPAWTHRTSRIAARTR